MVLILLRHGRIHRTLASASLLSVSDLTDILQSTFYCCIYLIEVGSTDGKN